MNATSVKLPSVFPWCSSFKMIPIEAHISGGFENTAYYVTSDTEKCNITTHFSWQAHDAWPSTKVQGNDDFLHCIHYFVFFNFIYYYYYYF